ncbi:hypothetical protein IU433_14255 [Nocardia puris]|uniref:hypothetical protein n=1 Tax=Nocardia puris TaxID=208602 RepID=UPI00189557F7|nr:hypothetical protein [Nocardia puris]MBF6460200.1 hypothetical protein [Nocardia puris]
MRKDTRPFIKVYVDLPRHPKFAGLSKAQKWMMVEAWCHCGEYLTDGVVSPAIWRGLGTKRDRDAVLATGIAVEFRRGEIVPIPNGSQLDSSEIRAKFESATGQILPTDCVLFLTYPNRQNLRANVESIQEKRRSAGQKGGAAKARNAAKKDVGGVASATANANQTGTKNVPEQEDKDKVPTYVGTLNTPSAAPSPTPIPSGFVEFWDIYPRRTDKGGARKAYAKAITRTDPALILDGARRFAADPNLPEAQFIPHASTWLNNERWTDGPLPTRHRPSPARTVDPAAQTLTPAELKFARAEALKDNPDPRILAAAGIPLPIRVASVTELDVWSGATAIDAVS